MQVARYEFVVKPMTAVAVIYGGIPILHSPFWSDMSIDDLCSLYLTLTANPAKICSILNSIPLNPNEERVFVYCKQFVGSMNQGMVRRFLRFVTGSSVCLTNQINVQFNSMSGIARRPISHTCDSMLELSSTYTSYPSFIEEFEAILSQPEVNWTMDAV